MIFYTLGILFVVCLLWYVYASYKTDAILRSISSIPYKSIKNHIKSGDIILFRANKFSWGSYFQKHYSITPFTHTGIIHKHPRTNRVYVLETHPISYNNICNVGKCENNDGINLYLLEDRIRGYDGTLYIKPLPYKISRESQKWFDRFVYRYNRKEKFPSNRRIVGNYVKRCMINRLNELKLLSSVNCSELVSYILKNITRRNIVHIGCSSPAHLSEIGSSKHIYRLI